MSQSHGNFELLRYLRWDFYSLAPILDGDDGMGTQEDWAVSSAVHLKASWTTTAMMNIEGLIVEYGRFYQTSEYGTKTHPNWVQPIFYGAVLKLFWCGIFEASHSSDGEVLVTFKKLIHPGQRPGRTLADQPTSKLSSVGVSNFNLKPGSFSLFTTKSRKAWHVLKNRKSWPTHDQ